LTRNLLAGLTDKDPAGDDDDLAGRLTAMSHV
jgi:hypothetical protein